MRTLVSYICHFVNTESINRYNVIKDGLLEGYDLIYVIPTSLIDTNSLCLLEGINYVCLELDKQMNCFNIRNNKHFNNNLIYYHVYKKYFDYDNYYFIEYDCLFNNNISDNWHNFFMDYDDSSIDLLCCHYVKYNNLHMCGPYTIEHMALMNMTDMCELINDGLIFRYNKLMIDNIYFSFLPLCKLSKDLLKMVNEYYILNNDIYPFFEYVIPTLATKYDMNIITFDDKYTQFIDLLSDNVDFLLNNGSMSWYIEDKDKYNGNILVHPKKITNC